MHKRKIITIDKLCQKLSVNRPSVKVIACSGSFDILHSAHALYLSSAKKLGDILVVFLNTDHSVQLYKGPGRPIISTKDRAELLALLAPVDYIVTFDQLNPTELIQKLKPDIFCNGADWGIDPYEKSLVQSYGGKQKIISTQTKAGITTSSIINKAIEKNKIIDSKVIFLDRDGVLITDKGYVHKIEDVEILPETILGLQKLKKDGWKFIVITNQSGIGRKMFKVADVEAVHKHINKILKKHNLTIEKFYYCPHTPSDKCTCRKPNTSLIEDAAIEYEIALSKSWFIGDKASDIEAGRRSNMKTIEIGNGISDKKNSSTIPNVILSNLDEAADFIIK
jgi:D-glycero-D-manno-heptose 1,7-bisphosphate phosphatase